jgi:hypothetical protein
MMAAAPLTACPSGEIGRRAALKMRFREECWFESGLGHQRPSHVVAHIKDLLDASAIDLIRPKPKPIQGTRAKTPADMRYYRFKNPSIPARALGKARFSTMAREAMT